MQGIGYTLKVWLSGLLLTPVIYSLLLVFLSNYQIPHTLGSIIVIYVIPYTLVVSVWMGLGLFSAITLIRSFNLQKSRIKLSLAIASIAMIFGGFAMLHHIKETLSYNENYILATAYAISTLMFVFLYDFRIKDNQTGTERNVVIKSISKALLYSTVVWLTTFLLSVPISLTVWYLFKRFHPGSSLKSAFLALTDNYYFQVNTSIAYFITVFLISLIMINLNMAQNRKKFLIMLFACPLSLPVYFYYLLFSGGLVHYPVVEFLILTLPALAVSISSILLIKLKPNSA